MPTVAPVPARNFASGNLGPQVQASNAPLTCCVTRSGRVRRTHAWADFTCIFCDLKKWELGRSDLPNRRLQWAVKQAARATKPGIEE